MEFKVNLVAIAPGMEYFPRLAHTIPIDLALAAIKAFLSYLNLYLYYHPILPSPNLPNFVIFKSEQDSGTIILALGYVGKTSFPLIFCLGVLTTINFSDLSFHTI